MQKSLYILILIVSAIFLTQCTEVYVPEGVDAQEALVVEAVITDGSGPYTIRLTKARPFINDTLEANHYYVNGAVVKITDSRKGVTIFSNTGPGIYTASSFNTVDGYTYTLSVKTQDGLSYESKTSKLLPKLSFDRVNAYYTTQEYFDYFGVLQNVKGVELRYDLFSYLPTLTEQTACRFDSKITLQYDYVYRDRDINGDEIMAYHWIVFGWRTVKMSSLENITDLLKAGQRSQPQNHVLGFIPQDAFYYRFVIPEPKLIYYIQVDQYTINSDAWWFYKSANDQLAAESKIFDPISSQVFGNMRCVTDPDKAALGLFEISPRERNAFSVDMTMIKHQDVSVEQVPVVNIPVDNEFQYRHWDDMSPTPNDPTYIVIPRPDWWYHQ